MQPRRSVQWALLAVIIVAVTFVQDGWAKPSFPAPPSSGSVISDAAGLISQEDAVEINRLAAGLLGEGYPVRVVTVRSLADQGAEDYTIEEYAEKLLRSWKLQEPIRSYVMLLLVSADDRTARIHLGEAWGQAHDGRARAVMTNLILPEFRRGEFSAGIVSGVRGFDAMGRNLALPRPAQPWWLLPALAAGALVLLAGVVSVGRNGRRSWAWAAAGFVLALVLSRTVGWAGASDSGGGATGDW